MSCGVKVTIVPPAVSVSIKAPQVGFTFGTPIARDYVERDPYEGDYEITPSAEVQVLATNQKRMTGNITVNPIPSNYGLITTDGSIITVS